MTRTGKVHYVDQQATAQPLEMGSLYCRIYSGNTGGEGGPSLTL